MAISRREDLRVSTQNRTHVRTMQTNLTNELDCMFVVAAPLALPRSHNIDFDINANSKKIHIDIDASNINKTIKVDIPIVGDVQVVMQEIITSWKNNKYTIKNKRVLE